MPEGPPLPDGRGDQSEWKDVSPLATGDVYSSSDAWRVVYTDCHAAIDDPGKFLYKSIPKWDVKYKKNWNMQKAPPIAIS
jgi:hypothetical protein